MKDRMVGNTQARNNGKLSEYTNGETMIIMRSKK